MGDPVTMAMVGAAIGGGVSASRGGDPIKGAMLGAVGGYTGGTMLGAGGTAAATTTGVSSATGAGASSIAPGLSYAGGQSAINTAAAAAPSAMTPAASLLAQQPAASYAGGNIAAAQQASAPSMFANFGNKVGAGFNALNSLSQQNPVLSQMAMGYMMQPEQQTQVPPAGLMRGNPAQMQRPQYQFGTPNISLI